MSTATTTTTLLEESVEGDQTGYWDVIAEPDGTLMDPNTKKKYSYLYYEARKKKPFQLLPDRCHCVKGTDAADFLEEALTIMGLNFKERNDFITYWLPHLESNNYNLIRFLHEEYAEEVQMDIEPPPDTVIRVFMVFKGIPFRVVTHPPPLRVDIATIRV